MRKVVLELVWLGASFHAKKGKKVISEIVPIVGNIQKQISFWDARVREKEEEAAALSIHIQDLKITLNVFLGEYYSRVGVLYVKLDKLKLRVEEYEYRINLVQSKKLSPEDLRDIEEDVEETFSEERDRARDLEDEASEWSEKAKIASGLGSCLSSPLTFAQALANSE